MIKFNKEDYDVLKLAISGVEETNKIQVELTLRGYRRNKVWYCRKFGSLKERGMIGSSNYGRTNRIFLTRIGEEYVKFYERIEK